MLKIVNEEIVDGYKIIYYSNGAIVKQSVHTITEPQSEQIPEPLPIESLMQAMTDGELRDFEIKQNQELLAQQMTDIEVVLLGGDR